MFINEITICGRMTRDVELRTLPSGVSVANFSVATNRTYLDSAKQKQEEVEFHNVVAFGKTAETIAQYIHKGDEVYIRGRLKTSSWEHEGTKRYKTEIITERFLFGQKRKEGATAPTTNTATEVEPEYPEEEIPF